MSCENVIDIVTRETGRFSQMIYDRVFPTSPWIGLIAKDTFPEGMGETISNLTYERSAPTVAEPTWSDVAVTDGAIGVEGGACLPAAEKISIGSTTRTWNLKRRVLEGPDFCAEELRTPFAIGAQLERIVSILAEYSRIEWEIRYRHEYLRLAGRKVVVNANLTEGTGTGFPVAQATSVLTQGVLDKYKIKLFRDGAQLSALGRENGTAIMTLITDAETSERIIFDNEDIRQDLRWAEPSALLKPFGVNRSYRGVYHLIDSMPIRYTYSGGYTEVAGYSTTAATKGNRAIVNPSWEVAPYTTSHFFDRTVFTARIPRPVVAPQAKFKFDPISYMGEFKAMNILDRICNPDGNILYHRAILAEASEPVHPERGISFVHLRCDPALNLVTSCS